MRNKEEEEEDRTELGTVFMTVEAAGMASHMGGAGKEHCRHL